MEERRRRGDVQGGGYFEVVFVGMRDVGEKGVGWSKLEDPGTIRWDLGTRLSAADDATSDFG